MTVDEFIQNCVEELLLFLAGLISRQRVASRKKKILRNRLSKDGWKWRRLKSLSLAIREDEPATKELLFENWRAGQYKGTRCVDVGEIKFASRKNFIFHFPFIFHLRASLGELRAAVPTI
jgi:hypothetical protein